MVFISDFERMVGHSEVIMVTRLSDGCQLGSMLRTDLDSNARFGFLGSIDNRYASAGRKISHRGMGVSV